MESRERAWEGLARGVSVEGSARSSNDVPTRYAPGPTTGDDDMIERSGPDWVKRFAGSRSIKDLRDGFRASVQRFVAAMTAAGADVKVAATLRPPERAYLMHWSWHIALRSYDARIIPPLVGVDIDWWHGDQGTSENAALAMVKAYGTGVSKVPPAIASRHTEGKAVDMRIAWEGALAIVAADGKTATIKSLPRDGTNKELISVGASYGVVHFKNALRDPPHWSTDGH
jgi:hypothetical protein